MVLQCGASWPWSTTVVLVLVGDPVSCQSRTLVVGWLRSGCGVACEKEEKWGRGNSLQIYCTPCRGTLRRYGEACLAPSEGPEGSVVMLARRSACAVAMRRWRDMRVCAVPGCEMLRWLAASGGVSQLCACTVCELLLWIAASGGVSQLCASAVCTGLAMWASLQQPPGQFGPSGCRAV